MKAMSYEEKYKMMTQTPVSRLISRLAVPTIISMLITSIYNMADTFFVSQLSTSASGAVGINFSLMAMIQAIGFTLGMGSRNYISRMLGAREQEKAQRACSTAVYTALTFGLALAVLGILNIDSLVRVLGATETIAPYAKDYGKYILIAAPYMTVSFVFNNHLRSQGNAVLSASFSVLCDHRKYADAIDRLQLPGNAYRCQQTGTLLYPGDPDSAPHLWRDRASACAACSRRSYFYTHTDYCGDGSAGAAGYG